MSEFQLSQLKSRNGCLLELLSFFGPLIRDKKKNSAAFGLSNKSQIKGGQPHITGHWSDLISIRICLEFDVFDDKQFSVFKLILGVYRALDMILAIAALSAFFSFSIFTLIALDRDYLVEFKFENSFILFIYCPATKQLNQIKYNLKFFQVS